MRWLMAAAVTLLAPAWANLALAQSPAISPTMRGPLGYVQVQIVSGRLNLTARQQIRTRNSTSSSSNDRRERMMVDMTGQHPAIDYELATSKWQLVIQARNVTQFHIARELREGGTLTPFDFRQDAEGDITFTIGNEESARQRRYSTLWHLLLAEGEAARTHLVPILDFFRPGVNLAVSVERITDTLFASADEQQATPRERWARLVAQLTDVRYARREAADRQLRAEGKTVLSYLDSLEAAKLDFEQRHRIRGIRRWLTRGDDNDAPESIAGWLAGDPRVWLALLQQADLERRQVAAQQLSRLLNEPISFDPAAPPETRSQQIEALRLRIDGTAASGEAKTD
jgi:hypothetical protein